MHLLHHPLQRTAVAAATMIALVCASAAYAQTSAWTTPAVAVGPNYDTSHVYVDSPDHLAPFVKSFTATFGGKASQPIPSDITPTPSKTLFQYVWSPVGMLSTFAFKTPVPYPFGSERNGYLVTNMDTAIKAATDCGASVLVAKFRDPIGYDAVLQWPGGVNLQLYWHFKKPSYATLETTPVNRVYVPPQAADAFVRAFTCFAHGKVTSNDHDANEAELGRPGHTFRRIRIESGFGRMQVNVTNGHLPYPFGRETTGYQVQNLAATLQKAKASGAKVLWGPYAGGHQDSAMLQFPGGYIAEVFAAAGR